jgi:DNA-binding MarR family transcriptional regulator
MRIYKRICSYVKSESPAMSTNLPPGPEECTCLAVRKAARHITQFYDQYLAPVGLRTTQFSILAKLKRLGPMTINALAGELVMDRTTLGRNVLPLERDGLISIVPGRIDRRSKELQLTNAGIDRLQAARKGWKDAQTRFATVFGEQRTAGLRALLCAVSAAELSPASAANG